MGMPVLDYSNPLVILKNVGQTYIVSKECYMFDNTNLEIMEIVLYQLMILVCSQYKNLHLFLMILVL